MAKSAVIPESDLLLLRITCIAWLIAKLISWKLWVSYRTFPIIPVFDFFPELPEGFHFLLFAASLVSLLLVILFPRQLLFIAIVLCVEIFSCLIDQMRWQPWQFQYLLTFLFFLFSHNKPGHFLKLTAFLIGATYFYSGIHKLSPGFLDAIWGTMMLHDFGGLTPEAIANPLLHYCGLLLGITEAATGLGLLFSRHKKAFFWMAVFMHGLILLVLGPFGLDFNEVIWVWNLTMPISIWILFYKNSTTIDASFLKPVFNKWVFLLIGILPLLNFAGMWDTYLSFNLYSGESQRFFICSKEITDEKLLQYRSPNRITGYCNEKSISISVDKMAFLELRVPVYPEERVYKAFKKQWIRKYPNAKNTFIIYDYPHEAKDIREIE